MNASNINLCIILILLFISRHRLIMSYVTQPCPINLTIIIIAIIVIVIVNITILIS